MRNYILIILLSNIPFTTNSALLERLGGLAYYDDEADITWLSDANYSKTTNYSSDGLMAWAEANTWAETLNVAGVSGWRLPITLEGDTSCHDSAGDVTYGFRCNGSEMGNLFYNTIGTRAFSRNESPFDNVDTTLQIPYWSATEYTVNPEWAWSFNMGGWQGIQKKTIPEFYAWAVHDGDVSAVPLPASLWLFSAGLIGIIGLTRRNT